MYIADYNEAMHMYLRVCHDNKLEPHLWTAMGHTLFVPYTQQGVLISGVAYQLMV